METSTNQKKQDFSKHHNFTFIAILLSPILIILYFSLFLITAPLTIIIYLFYKEQIKKHINELYQNTNTSVQNFINKYIVPIFTYTKEKLTHFLIEPINQIVGCILQHLLQYQLFQVLSEILKFIWALIFDFKNTKSVVIDYTKVIVSENKLLKFVVQFSSTYILPIFEKLYSIYSYLKVRINLDFKQVIAQYYLQIPLNKYQIIGYAILNESGKTIQNLNPEQEMDRYRIQLHQYAITQFWKIKNFKGQQILELQCGDAVGLNYIASAYEPQRCLGVDSSQQQIEQNQTQYQGLQNLKFETRSPIDIGALCAPNTFDVIIGLELKKKKEFQKIDFKSYIKVVSTLLKDDGYLIIGDYDTQEEIQKLQEEITVEGLVITEKNDFTVGVTQAMNLQIKNIKQKYRQRDARLIKWSDHLKPNHKQLQQFKDRQQIYMVYVLKKAKL